jgi:hypothetical protein
MTVYAVCLPAKSRPGVVMTLYFGTATEAILCLTQAGLESHQQHGPHTLDALAELNRLARTCDYFEQERTDNPPEIPF